MLDLIIDTREKKHKYIEKWFKKRNHNVIIRKLEKGDYSFIHNGVDYTQSFSIEKKSGKMTKGGGYAEIRGNLIGKDKFRFSKAVSKCKQIDHYVLLIENANKDSWLNLKTWKVGASYFKNKFDAFILLKNFERKAYNKPPIKIIHCNEFETPKVILEEIKKYLNEVEYYEK